MEYRLFLLTMILILLTACQTAVSETVVPTIQPTATNNQQPTSSPQPTDFPTPSPQSPTPTLQPPTPTPQPSLTVGFDTAVPDEVKTAVEIIVQEHPVQFALADADADLVLTVQEDAPIGAWTFAVAAPFPTFADDIALSEVQEAWMNGALVLTPEIEAILRGWWGDPDVAAMVVPADTLIATLWQTQTSYDDPVLTIVPFGELAPRLKVLAVDGNSPISVNYDQASYGLQLPLGWVGEDTAVSQIATFFPEPITNRHDDLITHITMTGPSGLSRAVADRMEKYGYQYPGEEIAPLMQAADIAHMSHENAFAPDCPDPKPTGGTTFCAQPKTIELMTWLGVDVVELTGNHLNDWGKQNLSFTLDLYDEVGIAGYGGGRNLVDAGEPLLIDTMATRSPLLAAIPWGHLAFGRRRMSQERCPARITALILPRLSSWRRKGMSLWARFSLLSIFSMMRSSRSGMRLWALPMRARQLCMGRMGIIRWGLLLAKIVLCITARATHLRTRCLASVHGRCLSTRMWFITAV